MLDEEAKGTSVEKASVSYTEDAVDSSKYVEMQRRHGRVDLVPLPSDSPTDPLNWPSWKKNVLLLIVAFHAMQGPFSAAIIIPAYQEIAAAFGVSLNQVTYLTSVQILVLGVMPLIWAPISHRIGRRPVYLISTLFSAAFALAGGYCNSYAALMATRIVQAIFIAPPQSIGASSVNEMFFSYQKGQKMGVWILLVTCGPILGPVSAGYLVQYKGWRTAQYLLAGIHLALFFAHLFFGPETIYPNRQAPGETTTDVEQVTTMQQYFSFHIYRKERIPLVEFIRPLFMAARPYVLLPALAYSITFSYTNVFMTVYVPQLFGEIFHLEAGPISLQFLALLVGAVLGEQCAGYGSDRFVNWRARKTGGVRVPESRLAIAPIGFCLAIIGLVVWGVQLNNATVGKWNITPDIGSAIAIFGQQLITTVCVTYAIESSGSEAAQASAFISLLRQVYAFTVPFYLPDAIASIGIAGTSGLCAGLIGLGMLMPMACMVWGARWRGNSQVI
ncbi:MFS general substrate transporter [Athelia psychrophila]|uniref:MFS general substrate transporter n=1 Tax=Athelia psychrophila TaxID=1759441 RepID=A0A166IAQ2_9AGAM|nr:MFS general substrate transporter [Fibularhizoctonia sp. CBS 109695]